ncbi:hypothetical protein OAD74_01335 [Alphaproteobacteria bacterium]|nr:hypothetical protein [Alphaproteobacteria bacterium]
MISSFASYGVKAKICLQRASTRRRSPALLTYSGFPIDAIVTGTGRRRFFAPLAARITTAYIFQARPF